MTRNYTLEVELYDLAGKFVMKVPGRITIKQQPAGKLDEITAAVNIPAGIVLGEPVYTLHFQDKRVKMMVRDNPDPLRGGVATLVPVEPV